MTENILNKVEGNENEHEITFGGVEIIQYRREIGGSCGVPDKGKYPLGLSFEIVSKKEMTFEEFAEESDTIEWIYKTGDAMFIYGVGQMKEEEGNSWSGKKSTCAHIEIDENIESITKHAFKDFTKVETVIIPTTVTTIGDFILRGCTSLTAITVPLIGA